MILSLNRLAKEFGITNNTLTAWVAKGKVTPFQTLGKGLGTRFLFELEKATKQRDAWDKKHPDNIK